MNPKVIKMLKKTTSKNMPFLRCGNFDGEYVFTTDLEHAVRVKFPTRETGVIENFEAVINRPELLTELKSFEIEDAPELPNFEGEWKPLKDLDKILEAGKCISKDTTRPILCSVCIENDKIIGCDGYVLYVSDTENDSMRLDKKTLDLLKTFKDWEYQLSEDAVHFRCGVVEVMAKQVSGVYPDIENITNRLKSDKCVEFDSKSLANELKGLGTNYFKLSEEGLSAVWEDPSKSRLDVLLETSAKKVEIPYSKTIRIMMSRTNGNLDIRLLKKLADKSCKVAWSDGNILEVF